MNIEEKRFLIEVARLASKRSHAVRLQVGAVVSDAEGNLIATGFNGTVRGYANNAGEYRVYDDGPYTHVNETGVPYKITTDHNMMIHAEENLVAHAARRGISIRNSTVFGTHSPCMKCCSLLIQCGVVEMIFLEKHHSFSDVKSTYNNFIALTHWQENVV